MSTRPTRGGDFVWVNTVWCLVDEETGRGCAEVLGISSDRYLFTYTNCDTSNETCFCVV